MRTHGERDERHVRALAGDLGSSDRHRARRLDAPFPTGLGDVVLDVVAPARPHPVSPEITQELVLEEDRRLVGRDRRPHQPRRGCRRTRHHDL